MFSKFSRILFGIILFISIILYSVFYYETSQMYRTNELILNIAKAFITVEKQAKVSGRPYVFETEWLEVNKDFYIKRSSGFYFFNESYAIVLGLLNSKLTQNYTIGCFFQIDRKKYHSNGMVINLGDKAYLSTISIECKLDNKLLKKAKYIYLRLNGSKKKLRLKVKYESLTKEKFLLCTKTVYEKFETEDNLKPWLEFNRKIGFDKIVIYNNSIPFEGYNNIFESHSGFVELKPYHFYPHMNLGMNYSGKEYRDLPYVSYSQNLEDKLKDANERLSQNECYSEYRYSYEYIAVYDPDELLVPFDNAITCYTRRNRCSVLMRYLKRLEVIYGKQDSFWFPYETFIPNLLGYTLMQELHHEIRYNSKQVIYLKIKIRQNEYLNITVDKIADKLYVRELLNQYRNWKNAKELSNISRRLSLNYITWANDGKSIHLTSRVRYVHTHHPLFTSFVQISREYGFMAHYRRSIHLYGKNSSTVSIRNLDFGVNRIECYV